MTLSNLKWMSEGKVSLRATRERTWSATSLKVTPGAVALKGSAVAQPKSKSRYEPFDSHLLRKHKQNCALVDLYSDGAADIWHNVFKHNW